LLFGSWRLRLTVQAKGMPHLRFRCTQAHVIQRFVHFPCVTRFVRTRTRADSAVGAERAEDLDAPVGVHVNPDDYSPEPVGEAVPTQPPAQSKSRAVQACPIIAEKCRCWLGNCPSEFPVVPDYPRHDDVEAIEIGPRDLGKLNAARLRTATKSATFGDAA
jgi:hypothetical protein